MYFLEKVKRVLLNERGFYLKKERFFPKIVPNMEGQVRKKHQKVQNVV
jgi:hypothetical protein